MAAILKEEITNIEKLNEDIFKMTISSDYISEFALPGQFVNIKCCDGINAILRRPISIACVDRSKKTFDIVFQVKGIGTQYLAQKEARNGVDIIGPLGTTFDISEEHEKVAVVGGGIGTFPLYFLLNELKKSNYNSVVNAYLGFRNKNAVVLTDKFSKVCDNSIICTDDGSCGYKGLVTDLLLKDLSNMKYDIIYACGPTPMLKAVAMIAKSFGIKCQVSLEQRMGCGIGACLVCSCKTKFKENDGWTYSRVCKDGPVFWSSDVIFE